MKHIKLFEQFINESEEYAVVLTESLNEATFSKVSFNSHLDHNPSADILQGHIDKDSYITYGIYVNGPKKGTEFMEYYSGENYKPGSGKKSSSRYFEAGDIPTKYKSMWDSLKATYRADYAGKNKPSTLDEAADFTLDNIKRIIKGDERWSDSDFKVTMDKGQGIAHIVPKGNRRLRKALSELEKLFDVIVRAEEIDDEREDFYEYFVKAKGTDPGIWKELS